MFLYTMKDGEDKPTKEDFFPSTNCVGPAVSWRSNAVGRGSVEQGRLSVHLQGIDGRSRLRYGDVVRFCVR